MRGLSSLFSDYIRGPPTAPPTSTNTNDHRDFQTPSHWPSEGNFSLVLLVIRGGTSTPRRGRRRITGNLSTTCLVFLIDYRLSTSYRRATQVKKAPAPSPPLGLRGSRRHLIKRVGEAESAREVSPSGVACEERKLTRLPRSARCLPSAISRRSPLGPALPPRHLARDRVE